MREHTKTMRKFFCCVFFKLSSEQRCHLYGGKNGILVGGGMVLQDCKKKKKKKKKKNGWGGGVLIENNLVPIINSEEHLSETISINSSLSPTFSEIRDFFDEYY